MKLLLGDSLHVLKSLPAESIDSVVTDPPYALAKRAYGSWTEHEWLELMTSTIKECARVLKPDGSMVIVVKPNSRSLGVMSSCVWRLMADIADGDIVDGWGIVQDAYWWNIASPPTAHARREIGLMRPSLAYCIWAGSKHCFRCQELCLWEPSTSQIAIKVSSRAMRETRPSGMSIDIRKVKETVIERGGVTPYNVLPMPNTNSTNSGGAWGHPAATPLPLTRWWVRYLTQPGGVVLDPFMGSGTTAIAAAIEGFDFVGIERDPEYLKIAQARIAHWSQRPASSTPKKDPNVLPGQLSLFGGDS